MPFSPNQKVRKRVLFIAASLSVLILSVIVYRPGLHGPFVFDDQSNLLQQSQVQIADLSPTTLWQVSMLRDDAGFLRRPVAMISFAVTYYFAKFDPFVYKVTNLAIHILCGILIFLLCNRLLGALRRGLPQVRYSNAALRWLSLGVAALWLVHPLNLTSVLYVVQRMNGLATLFTLAGLTAYTIGRDRIAEGRNRGLLIIALTLPLFTLLAVASKENGILLPVFAILIEVTVFRFAAAPAMSKRFRWFWWTVVAGPVVLGLLAIAIEPSSLLRLSAYQQRDFTMSERLLTEARVLWFYVRLILLPDFRDMGLYHDDLEISRGILEPVTTVFAIGGIFALIAIAILGARRQPILALGILWFLVGHSLESSVIPLELAHDHRNYLPMFGPLLIVAWYLVFPYRNLEKSQPVRWCVLAGYLLLLSGATFVRAQIWHDEWALVTQDAINHPNSSRAHGSLAITLHNLGMEEQAHAQFVLAANLNPFDTSTIVRAVQHYYLWKKTIPEDMLQELDTRMQHYPFQTTTAWVYEPLIHATRDNRKLQQRVLGIYEKSAWRRDTYVPAPWRARAQYTIAMEDFRQGHYKKTVDRLAEGIALSPDIDYYLLASDACIKLNDRTRAQELVAALDDLHAALNARQTERLNNIRQWLLVTQPGSRT